MDDRLPVDVRRDALAKERLAVGEIRRHGAHDDERQPHSAGDRDRAVGPLVRNEPSDRDQEVLRLLDEADPADLDAVGDDRQPSSQHAILGLGDAHAPEARVRRAVVVVQGFLDVRVRHHARLRRRVGEVRRRSRPVRMEHVEPVRKPVRLRGVADLVLTLLIRGDRGIVLGRPRHDRVQMRRRL